MAKVATATSIKELTEIWQQHCYLEFVKKDAKAALSTTKAHAPAAVGRCNAVEEIND